ncbi:hypothetical protein SAMN05216251_11838 [Actinacidiphila alni]|uniref:Uncharacterized protein n=1 Tax=Actinacidiphila alni TaxID=380248 RepID=A0A1I2JLZ1_9ACTN|nr:hypothetical protein SAMN05216251_11838 [Actinacidiphila alni]
MAHSRHKCNGATLPLRREDRPYLTLRHRQTLHGHDLYDRHDGPYR